MAYDPYTKSLLHFNGANQSQVFTDELGNVWTATGTSQLDTAEKVFGSASMHNTGTGNYISAPFNAALNPGTGNFTLDFRFKWNGNPASAAFFQMGPSNSDGCKLIWVSNTLNFTINNTGYNFAWTPSASTWYHIAITRQAGTLRAWVDGAQKGADTTGAGDISPASGTMYIGHYIGVGYEPNAWFDELRWSNGIARWSTTFDPPFYEYGGSLFVSDSSIVIPTVTNQMTITAEKFWALGSLVIPTLYNEAWTGDADNDLPVLTCVATGHDGTAELSVTLPNITISATGLTGGIGSLSQTLHGLTIQSHGLTGQIGQLIATLPTLIIAATGSIERHGTLDLTLPLFYINAHGEYTPVGPIYRVTVLNPKNMAVTEYEFFDFNSFGFFNGVYLGAKSDGIYPLGSEKDNGSDIDSSFRLGQFNLDVLRPRDLYLFGRGGGTYKAIIVGDEDTENEVTVSYLLSNLNEERVKLPRGLEPTYMQIGFENVDGADFEIDSIQVYAQKMRTVRK